MKVSRTRSEENRQAVIDNASRLFRERGFDGIGVANLMKSAGLTQGGFYKKFRSKEDLAAQACARAFEQGKNRWTRVALKATNDPFAAIVRSYLSARHSKAVGESCAVAALGCDAARQGPELRRIFEAEIEALVEILDRASAEKPSEATHDQSIAALSTMVGALLISRAVNDPGLSERGLKAGAEAVIAGRREVAEERYGPERHPEAREGRSGGSQDRDGG